MPSPRRSTVKPALTASRHPRVVENSEFAAFGRRIIRAAGRRVAAGDVDALPELAALSADLDAAITTAVTGLRGAGYSWGEIASRLGVTRQAAHQRWATAPTSTAEEVA
jgi:DNA-directed RNA polymerase specialized sigma24 family protein